jgi:hypothetical protein
MQQIAFYYRIHLVYFIYLGKSTEASRQLLLEREPGSDPVPFSSLREECETVFGPIVSF